jgi:cobyrinic acid a,c-diamide synthase
MDDATLAACFAQHSAGADLALVEGNKGLFDGLALDGSNSNAALAARSNLPVLLVHRQPGHDAWHCAADPGLPGLRPQNIRIGGVILNRVGGSRHEAKLRAVIEHYTDVPVLGAVAEDPQLAMTERHLGLMPTAEVADAQQRVQAIGRIVGGQVDLHRVKALAATAPSPGPRHCLALPSGGRCAHRHRAGPRLRLLLPRRPGRAARSRRRAGAL